LLNHLPRKISKEHVQDLAMVLIMLFYTNTVVVIQAEIRSYLLKSYQVSLNACDHTSMVCRRENERSNGTW